MIDDMVGDGNRAAHIATVRKATGNQYEKWRKEAAGADAVDLYRMLGEVIQDAERRKASVTYLDDAMHSVTTVVSGHLRDYNHRMLRSCMAFLEKRDDLLLSAITNASHEEGAWQYEIWDTFWDIMTYAVRNEDLWMLTRATRLFVKVVNQTFERGNTDLASMLQVRMLGDTIRDCTRHKTYFMLAMFLQEVGRHEIVKKNITGPSAAAWKTDVPDMLMEVLYSIIREENVQALRWVFDPVLWIHSAFDGIEGDWMGVVPGAIEYCGEKGRVAMLGVMSKRLLDAERDAALPGNLEWVARVADSLVLAASGGVHNRSQEVIKRYENLAKSYPEDGTIRRALAAILT